MNTVGHLAEQEPDISQELVETKTKLTEVHFERQVDRNTIPRELMLLRVCWMSANTFTITSSYGETKFRDFLELFVVLQ